jgi:hypothetical protein
MRPSFQGITTVYMEKALLGKRIAYLSALWRILVGNGKKGRHPIATLISSIGAPTKSSPIQEI